MHRSETTDRPPISATSATPPSRDALLSSCGLMSRPMIDISGMSMPRMTIAD